MNFFLFRCFLRVNVSVSQSSNNSIFSFSRPGFERGSRKARDLAAKYNLGNPVAGNLFEAEHEGWCFGRTVNGQSSPKLDMDGTVDLQLRLGFIS